MLLSSLYIAHFSLMVTRTLLSLPWVATTLTMIFAAADIRIACIRKHTLKVGNSILKCCKMFVMHFICKFHSFMNAVHMNLQSKISLVMKQNKNAHKVLPRSHFLRELILRTRCSSAQRSCQRFLSPCKSLCNSCILSWNHYFHFHTRNSYTLPDPRAVLDQQSRHPTRSYLTAKCIDIKANLHSKIFEVLERGKSSRITHSLI